MVDMTQIRIRSRSKNRFAVALESTLRTFADPIGKRLKVRSGVKAGGLCLGCGGNHNRRLLVVGR